MRQLTELFRSGKIGSMEVNNRIIQAAMGNALAIPEGYVTEDMIEYYLARVRGGVGLIISQATNVSTAAGTVNMRINDDKYIPGLKRLSAAVHRNGGKMAIQLAHLGLVLLKLEAPQTLVIPVPSILPWMSRWMELGVVFKEMSLEDIDHYVEDFAEAVRRTRDAGFDGVEFHAAHGLLINEFMSSVTNRRTDEYGGSAENRARFICDILTRSRKKAGLDFPLIVRMNGDDDYEGGTTSNEAVQQAVLLEQAGADAVNISAGIEYLSAITIPCYLYPSGPMVPLAAKVKKAVNIPVITAGRMNPILGERVIREGKADFIALGRPLLADPELPNKAREGRLNDIYQCISCNNCISGLAKRPMSCTVNPFLFREKERALKSTTSPRRIMVVGGGPAGMQAAMLLAQRGHKVSLYERNQKLGGQWNIATAQESKSTHSSFLEHLSLDLNKSGVEIILGKNVTKKLVQHTKPDVVILATGAFPQILDVPGADGRNVLQANDVLSGKVKVGEKVVVIGARSLGMEVSIQLAEQGKKVSLVSRGRLGGTDVPVEAFVYRALMKRLINLRVPLYPHCPVREITRRGVYIEIGEDLFMLEADTVVLAVGARSDNKLAEELQDSVPEIFKIGDCSQPRNVREATDEATEVALGI
ncbi:FAD-dependent oxidoreductase [Chloroflexota bacterium]